MKGRDKERFRILCELDVDAALQFTPYHPPGGINQFGQFHDTRFVVLAALHKARVAQRRLFTKQQVDESLAWLQMHGYSPTLQER